MWQMGQECSIPEHSMQVEVNVFCGWILFLLHQIRLILIRLTSKPEKVVKFLLEIFNFLMTFL